MSIKSLSVVIFATSLLTLFSCGKCTVCHYTYIDANGNKQWHNFPDECGDRNDVKSYIINTKAIADTIPGAKHGC